MKRTHRIIAAVVILGAVLDSWRLRWLSDDAFISFRYAQHLAEHGELVYNPGEFVEGYTNFLWTLLMALGMKAGLEPEFFSHLLSSDLRDGCLLGGLRWCGEHS